ncbi:hypothetical protein PRZ48_014690 [Zasmidium cellare]|uniref:Uncharacterized protein n=1 Tax=Zasmidium cellare TaxID=395010 RepID=A0ABR0DZ06_ZASCE|nr:hypothetical protein PRZ48_014690 [Zasmidium cellare]
MEQVQHLAPPKATRTRRRKPRHIITTLQNASGQENSGLFKLPAGLRNRIYELAFKDTTVCVRSKTKNEPDGATVVPGLLLACKLLYAEALQIHFANTIFEFTSTTRIAQWLRNIGPENRELVARVDFRLRSTRQCRIPWFFHGRVKEIRDDVLIRLLRQNVIMDSSTISIIQNFGPGSTKERVWFTHTGSDGTHDIVYQWVLPVSSFLPAIVA